MKLLQWNVWYQEDIDNILQTITAAGADILCLQELTTNFMPRRRDTARYLSEKLGMHCFYKAARETIDADGGHTFGNAIISRYPILETAFHFVRLPSAGADAPADPFEEPRVYLEARLRIGGRRLDVGTIHMSYAPEFEQTAAKRAEADALVEILRRKRRRFVIGGDFNSLPESYTILAVQKYLRDVGPEKNQNTWTTKPFSYGGFSADTRDWRIDYCFATQDIQVRSARIVEAPYSDHLPILVDFEL